MNSRIKSLDNHALRRAYSYAVVEFEKDKTIYVVPILWVTDPKKENTLCWWPSSNEGWHVKHQTIPDKSWKMFQAKVIHFSCSYDSAMTSLGTCEQNSDVDLFSSISGMESKDEDEEDEESCVFRRKLSNITFNRKEVPQSTPPPTTQHASYRAASLSNRSPSHSNSPQTECSCSLNEGLLRQVLKSVEEIKEQMAVLNENQTKIQMALAIDVENIDDCGLPVKSLDEVGELNEKLKNEPETFSKMVKYLGMIGGRDVNDSVRAIMSKLILNDVAKQMNWVGSINRKGFKEYQTVINLVATSVRQNRLLQHAQRKDCEEVMKRWLRTALDREGGRNKRKKMSDSS